MKNWEIKVDSDGMEWICLNWAFFDNMPIKWSFEDFLKNDISSLVGIMKILEKSDYENKKKNIKNKNKIELEKLEEKYKRIKKLFW